MTAPTWTPSGCCNLLWFFMRLSCGCSFLYILASSDTDVSDASQCSYLQYYFKKCQFQTVFELHSHHLEDSAACREMCDYNSKPQFADKCWAYEFYLKEVDLTECKMYMGTSAPVCPDDTTNASAITFRRNCQPAAPAQTTLQTSDGTTIAPNATQAVPGVTITPPAAANTTPAAANTTPAAANTTPAAANTAPADANTTPAAANTTPAPEYTTPAAVITTPATASPASPTYPTSPASTPYPTYPTFPVSPASQTSPASSASPTYATSSLSPASPTYPTSPTSPTTPTSPAFPTSPVSLPDISTPNHPDIGQCRQPPKCYCTFRHHNNTTTTPTAGGAANPPHYVIKASELVVDVKQLSARRRRKESSRDPRPSTSQIGGVWLMIMICVFAAIVLSDLPDIYRNVRYGEFKVTSSSIARAECPKSHCSKV